MRLNLKRMFERNKFLFGFYFGMILTISINTFVGYEKENLIGFGAICFVILICIIMIWGVDQLVEEKNEQKR